MYADRIKMLRQQRGMSQQTLGEMLGVSAATANRILGKMAGEGRIQKIRIGKSWGYQ